MSAAYWAIKNFWAGEGRKKKHHLKSQKHTKKELKSKRLKWYNWLREK